ncbi:hypothetical protein SISNIDRAFT_485863 [Sistotremastrum niveocremeum HHB9708]|uniref:Mitochondrial K+-H+ exchange-related-domain-containing protein n=1 Tax=Sistotremastrum niveocremeum HHB9708 TaxID=1314777 RepID=A0A164U4H9_9AGAM|nr:hypothetical protein SISNIDRAFT_485863 [Sistotremastrum niveocremeum HHB9708]
MPGQRIIALPLTTLRVAQRSGFPIPFVYYHLQTTAPPTSGEDAKQPGILKRVTEKAASTWASFGKAPEGNWRLRTFRYGERIMDRIDFEELALKSFDPAMGPRITKVINGESSEEKKLEEKITLFHPTEFGAPLGHLKSLLEKRTPLHRRGFYTWLGIAPLTAPFMIVPIIPNLPFFFSAWRSWSHYRAWKSSEHIEELLEHDLIETQPSKELDAIYESTQSEGTDASVLLSAAKVPDVVSLFGLPETASADLLRALEQVKLRLKGGSEK